MSVLPIVLPNNQNAALRWKSSAVTGHVSPTSPSPLNRRTLRLQIRFERLVFCEPTTPIFSTQYVFHAPLSPYTNFVETNCIPIYTVMAGNSSHPIHIHPVRPLYRFTATALGASMWFFVSTASF